METLDQKLNAIFTTADATGRKLIMETVSILLDHFKANNAVIAEVASND